MTSQQQQQILDLAPPLPPPPPAPPSPSPPPPPASGPAPFAAEQLCYVHCHLCDTVLAVSVPCTSLFKTVTVRCGHCTNLLPVNMRALFLPAASAVNHHHHHQLHFPHHNLFNPPQNLGLQDNEIPKFGHDSPVSLQMMGTNRFRGSGHGPVDDQVPPRNPVTNRPPEKRQRVPSAYNRFIKEEIQRIKAGNPDISHREAFSAAAKNWAHFPHIHFGLMPDQIVKKTTIGPQEGEDCMVKDDFLGASANVGVAPY